MRQKNLLSFLSTLLAAALLAGCSTPAPQPSTPTPTLPASTLPASTLPSPTAPLQTQALQETVEDPSGVPEESTAGWIAYIGPDGNVRIVDRISGEQRQVTRDGAPNFAPPSDTGLTITYRWPQWSSDGRYLSFQQDVATPVGQGLEYSFALWVYDLEGGEARVVLEDQLIAGYGWRPGTHTLSYGLQTDPNYFAAIGQVNPDRAYGIWSVDVDTGETVELVSPAGGFSIVSPQWWGDGHLLTFEEVTMMEGRGNFAYYDFDAGQYISWEAPVGGHSLSPDGERVAYDYMIYIPTGTERVWVRDLAGGEEQPLSPEYEPGYAYSPEFSPAGDQLAYLASLTGPDSQEIAVFVIDLAGGEPRRLGVFEQPLDLSWSPDSRRLIFSAGPYDQQQLMEITPSTGEVRNLGGGSQPVWQPEQP